MILVYFTIGSTSSGSAFVIAPILGAKTVFESISLWRWLDDSSPYISWSSLPIQIHHTFVLFKDVTLTWINYLETWLCSDNTSCYYIMIKSIKRSPPCDWLEWSNNKLFKKSIVYWQIFVDFIIFTPISLSSIFMKCKFFDTMS